MHLSIIQKVQTCRRNESDSKATKTDCKTPKNQKRPTKFELHSIFVIHVSTKHQYRYETLCIAEQFSIWFIRLIALIIWSVVIYKSINVWIGSLYLFILEMELFFSTKNIYNWKCMLFNWAWILFIKNITFLMT